MSAAGRVTEEVRALARLDLHQLRAEWRRRGYGEPPKLRSPDLVRHMLAWRMQAEVLGGLDPETRRALRRTGSVPKRGGPSPGSRIAREYDGVVHEVEVVTGGYRYAGQVHRSLSTIARRITGTRWNGPRFFGLRAPEQAP